MTDLQHTGFWGCCRVQLTCLTCYYICSGFPLALRIFDSYQTWTLTVVMNKYNKQRQYMTWLRLKCIQKCRIHVGTVLPSSLLF